MKKFLKIVFLVLCLILLVWFGVCGVWGVGMSLLSGNHDGMNSLVLMMGLIGLAISVGFGFAMRALVRSLSASDTSADVQHGSPDAPPEQ